MSGWIDHEAEEEWFQSRIDNIKSQLKYHVITCLACEGTPIPRCIHGFEIIEELENLKESLRKTRLKNMLYP